MLTFEQITQLVDLVAKHRLEGVEVEKSGFRLKISGHRETQVVAVPFEAQSNLPAAVPPLAARAAAPAVAPPAAPAPASEDEGLHIVASPIVGTFYRAPSPDAQPFVEVGSRVTRGSVLCIIEAMKLMNEIEADIDGVVEKIYPANAQAVEYGAPLFGIRPH